MSIRDVRPTDDCYHDLDQALAQAGAVPRADFGLHVLPEILGRFATSWDQLAMPIPGRTDYRTHLGYSDQLGAYAVEGQMARDGVIELTSLTVDVMGLIEPDEPSERYEPATVPTATALMTCGNAVIPPVGMVAFLVLRLIETKSACPGVRGGVRGRVS
ncbi:MAG: hypothetical protein ACKVZ6_02010 [Kineosporiaceae bacterium]